MRSQLSRADLLKCLAAHDSVDWEKFAGVLGYTKHAEIVLKVNNIFQAQTLGFIGDVAMPSASPNPVPQTRFLRPLSRRRLNPEGIQEPEWYRQAEAFIDENDPAISAPEGVTPPPTPPLMPWPRLWPFLKWALGALLVSHQPDMPKTIARLAKGEWLRRLPRARRFGWAGECLVLIDFAEPLVPFWGDFHGLKQCLPQMRGRAGLKFMAFPDGDPLGRVWRERDEKDWQTISRFPLPRPNTPILVLSDLGCNDREPHRRQRWQRLGEKLKRAGCRPVALMPCPPRRWDGGLAQYYDLACWDRTSRLPRQHRTLNPTSRPEGLEPQDNAENLLALLSPAIRVEPGLLRNARLMLPARQADVGTEASAWNHADIQPTLTAFYYEPAAQTRHRQRFQSDFETSRQQAMARLTAEHHAPLSPFIGLEEALVFAELMGEENLPAELAERIKHTQALLQKLARTCADSTQLAEAAKAWASRFGGRDQPPSLWAKHGAMEAAWAMAHREALADGRIEKLPPGLSLSRVAWVLAGQAPREAWRLSQVGDELHLVSPTKPAEKLPSPSGRGAGGEGLEGGTANAQTPHRGIPIASLESAGAYATLESISEAQALGLMRFFHPKPAENLPAPTLLSLIHPTQFGQEAPPSPRPFSFNQPIPLPEADYFRLTTDHEDWLFDQISKPAWADAIGRDRQGLYVEVQAGPERLKLYWQPNEAKDTEGLLRPGTWSGFEALGRDGFGLWADLAVYQWKQAAFGDAFGSPSNRFSRTTQRFRRILPGRFLMGSPENEPERESFGSDETQHEVTLTHGFWLAETACTQAFWQAVMGNNPSGFNDDPQNPVETVSWQDAQTFIARLNEWVPGLAARLPSEAEWEYACRAGTTTPFSFGQNITPEQVNYDGNYPYAGGRKGQYREKTVPVKTLPPNPWGLYEMHGNVWEWCQDWFGDYDPTPQQDPPGPLEGQTRVLRGGPWIDLGRNVRSAIRDGDGPDSRGSSLGFRLALGPTGQPVRQEAPGPAAARERGGLAGGGPDNVMSDAGDSEGYKALEKLKTGERKKRRRKK